MKKKTMNSNTHKTRALYPGSFDPLTNGHIDIIKRSLHLFDEVIVIVAGTVRKSPLFSPQERAYLIKKVFKNTPEVKVDLWSGLIMEYAREHKIKAVVRGLRAASDFEYEFMMASMNKKINADVETIFMMTSQDLFFVSSTMVKELFLYGGDISPYVPKEIFLELKNKKKNLIRKQ